MGFACETLGVNNMMHHQYSQVFTVTYEEVFASTEIHGIPKTPNLLTEGFHYYKEAGKWSTFFRERGYSFGKKI